MASYDDTATVSGSVVSIENGADDVPTKSLVVTIPATLDGVSSVTENQTGRNLLDTAIAETKENNSVSITCDGNGKYTASGTATGGSANITFVLDTPCEIKSGMYLHLMNASANASASITLQKQDNTTIYAPALSPANRIADLSSYAGQTIYSIRFYVANGASFEMDISPMLCYSNTASSYVPYIAPTTYTANLGRTIYGGEVDIVNGTGTDENGNDFTFTGQEVPTRLGYNAFWSEQGNTELTYYKSGYGYTSVTVNKTGKNFLDDTLLNLEQGSINGSTGANENANNRVRNASAIPFPYDKIVSSYTWTIPSGYKAAIRPYDKNGNFVQLPSWALGFITQLPQNLIGQGITQMKFVLAKTDNSAITPSEMANIGFQIELGSQATEYESYESVSKTAKFHRIVYEGEVDAVMGMGKVSIGESGTEYDPPETFTFPPISISTDQGENTLFANEGASAITYRKETD